MKNIVIVLALFIGSLLSAQTGKEIIERNIQATGGLTNWKLLNSVLLQGKLVLGVNDEYQVKIYQSRPNLTKTSIMIDGKETAVEGFDGKKGYAMDYRQNKLISDAKYKVESFDNDFIDFENKGFTANYLGIERVGDRNCFKVELIKNVNRTFYYFDTQTNMLLKEEKQGETLQYSGFKKVGNLTFPFRIESASAAKDSDYVILISKVDTNKAFPANTFKF